MCHLAAYAFQKVFDVHTVKLFDVSNLINAVIEWYFITEPH